MTAGATWKNFAAGATPWSQTILLPRLNANTQP
jgi:hypothetical protein